MASSSTPACACAGVVICDGALTQLRRRATAGPGEYESASAVSVSLCMRRASAPDRAGGRLLRTRTGGEEVAASLPPVASTSDPQRAVDGDHRRAPRVDGVDDLG